MGGGGGGLNDERHCKIEMLSLHDFSDVQQHGHNIASLSETY